MPRKNKQRPGRTRPMTVKASARRKQSSVFVQKTSTQLHNKASRPKDNALAGPAAQRDKCNMSRKSKHCRGDLPETQDQGYNSWHKKSKRPVASSEGTGQRLPAARVNEDPVLATSKTVTDDHSDSINVDMGLGTDDTSTSEAEVQSKSTQDKPTSTNPKTIEIDESDKKLYSINMFQSDFDELLNRIPRNIREEARHATDCPKMVPITNITGMRGGTANGATALGSVNGKAIFVVNVNDWNGSYDVKKAENKSEITHTGPVSSGGNENSGEPKVDVRIQVPKEKQEMVLSKTEEQKDKLEKVDGVRDVQTSQGSIIITFTLEKGYVVTEEWIKGILRILFDDILEHCVLDGEIFRVDVQRRVQYTYNLLNDAKIHENCIMKTEHLKQTDELREEIERLRQTEETESTMAYTPRSAAEVQIEITPEKATSTRTKAVESTMAYTPRSAAEVQIEITPEKATSTRTKAVESILTLTPTSETKGQTKLTPEKPTSNPKTTVVQHTKDKQRRRTPTVPKQCRVRRVQRDHE